MRPPFTTEEFHGVFAVYNSDVWPMQFVLAAAAILAFVLILTRKRGAGRAVAAILAFFWAWAGIAYHLAEFTSISGAAWLFGSLFLVQAALFVLYGTIGGRITFELPEGARAVAGSLLVFYSLFIYPFIGMMSGHAYMASPTFGVPCPVTLFTVGMFFFPRRPFPGLLLVIPVVWSVVGSSAALYLSVPQDFGLFAAAAAGIYLFAVNRRKRVEAHSPDVD